MPDDQTPIEADASEGTGSNSGAVAGPNMVIGFHYDLYDGKAQKMESSKAGEPVLCLHGERGVLLALQDAFVGKVAGDDFSITIPHEKAYGRRYPDRKQRLPRKKIDGGKQQTFRPGQVITMQGEHGPSPATVIKVGKFNIDVDVNHPLAGVDLTFDIQIVSVRESSAEERAHGHAHGVGGHHH
ncbi:FKBP-type peptidyl-prolyl cis-trans isomerase [Granulosicoccus antarcticus]|uniref:FKBP-type peptidyl-prolyl cis-trans isomerase SlyD n=1 Tax=Granulosicoccus antarcticus IMCC3135 TaxID=1192854 RepID=A0A2Z2NV17_9GAMM|nr:FKBP-type peptidyl-prolyl cis-trans isomerase [Granulosicoccus antarcticus]ASJ75392.1 FKBP-type peptidyl-prolyl cis-trans isomerase SlyD [Granulosicoccus antarcticus IMCC3135]